MPRPSWATDEQVVWLSSRRAAFVESQAAKTSRAFLNATAETFLQKWPPLPPTDVELAEAGGDEDKYYKMKKEKKAKQIDWWLRNRERPGAGGGGTTNSTAVLDLKPQRTHPLMPYQAYMHLYSARVMPLIKANYEEYKANLPEGETPREAWGWSTAEAKRLLELEPEKTQSAVAAYRQLHANSTAQFGLDLEALLKDGPDAAKSRVQAMQQRIECLARTAFVACKAIEEQTGWKATMLLGGPNPETGRMTTLAVHNGRTHGLENIFSEATDQWSVIQNEWDSFVARGYPPGLCERLERFYRGDFNDDDFLPESPPEPDTNDPTVITPSPAENETTETAPPATSMIAASFDPLAYERQRLATIAHNQEILQRLVDDTTFDNVVQALDLEKTVAAGIKALEKPAWLGPAKEYLDGIATEPAWVDLVLAWSKFERALKYPDGSAQSNWLSPTGRPQEAKHWISRGRKYNKPPKMKSLDAFVQQFKKWWSRLQPNDRRDPEEPWPLLPNIPEDPKAWSDLKRGGCNGIFVVIMCLSWWYMGITDGDGDDDSDNDSVSEEDLVDWRETVNDVKWVIATMISIELKDNPGVLDESGDSVSAPSAHTSIPSAAPNGGSSGTTILPAVPATVIASPAPSDIAPVIPASGTVPPAPVAISDIAPAVPAAGTAPPAPAPPADSPPAVPAAGSGPSVPAPPTDNTPVMPAAGNAPAALSVITPVAPAAGSAPAVPAVAAAPGTVAASNALTGNLNPGVKRTSVDPDPADAPAAKRQHAEGGASV